MVTVKKALKVLSQEFFGGRRSSAGSRLFALLLASFLLFGPLAFSGFGQRSSAFLPANFTLYHRLLGARKIAERTSEPHGPKPEKAGGPQSRAEKE